MTLRDVLNLISDENCIVNIIYGDGYVDKFNARVYYNLAEDYLKSEVISINSSCTKPGIIIKIDKDLKAV